MQVYGKCGDGYKRNAPVCGPLPKIFGDSDVPPRPDRFAVSAVRKSLARNAMMQQHSHARTPRVRA